MQKENANWHLTMDCFAQHSQPEYLCPNIFVCGIYPVLLFPYSEFIDLVNVSLRSRHQCIAPFLIHPLLFAVIDNNFE